MPSLLTHKRLSELSIQKNGTMTNLQEGGCDRKKRNNKIEK